MHARYWWHQLLSPNACAVSAPVKHLHAWYRFLSHTACTVSAVSDTACALPIRISRCYIRNARHHLVFEECMRVTECISYGHPPHTQCHLLSSTTRTSCRRTPCMRGITLLSRTLCMRGISCCSTLHAQCQFPLSTACAVSVVVTHGMCVIMWCHALHARYQVLTGNAAASAADVTHCMRGALQVMYLEMSELVCGVVASMQILFTSCHGICCGIFVHANVRVEAYAFVYVMRCDTG